ncbi:MAG: sigma-70 family RNA polymerase sigma factor [Actinomycetota bacterium]
MAPKDLVLFCELHHPRLVGMLSLYCGDAAVAEELAQEALLTACRQWRRVRAMDNPAGWLHRVGVNLANSHYRRRSAERRARDRLEGRSGTRSSPDVVATLTLRRAVADLPKRQKTALVLRYYADLPFAEVARLMDAPEPTVKSLVRRAVEKLRSHGFEELEEVPNAH